MSALLQQLLVSKRARSQSAIAGLLANSALDFEPWWTVAERGVALS